MRPSISYYARAAAQAARAAGSLLAQHVGEPRTVETKQTVIDLVTEIDRASERLIQRLLHRADPTIGFLGEEQGHRESQARARWIVDPLDGTMNFVHGMPFFGVSIGLEHEGRMAVGVIYDPLRKELFSAVRGGGTFLNGRRVRVSRTRLLSKSLLATGFSSRFRTQPQPYLRWFHTLESKCHAVRRMGSTALCLAYVACGRLDGFYERELWPWDIAAGLLLVQEAGGQVSNLEGRPVVLEEGRLIASNGRIHRELVHVLYRSRTARTSTWDVWGNMS